jgi:hypothetical protein
LSAAAWSCIAWSGFSTRPKHASKPGYDLLPFEPLAPSRILGATNVLDHGEVAQAQNAPERPSLSVMVVLTSIARYSRSWGF